MSPDELSVVVVLDVNVKQPTPLTRGRGPR